MKKKDAYFLLQSVEVNIIIPKHHKKHSTAETAVTGACIRQVYTTRIHLKAQHTDNQRIIKGRLLRYKRRPFVQ